MSSSSGFPGLLERSESNGMPPFQQSLSDKANYQEFEREISDVLDSALIEHGLLLARAWVPCVLNPKCGDERLGCHRNSVFVLDVKCNKNSLYFMLYHDLACTFFHTVRGEGIVGKAFMTNQAFFSQYSAYTSKKKDPLCPIGWRFHHAAIAVPLRSSIHNSEYVFEFFFPFECTHLEGQKKIATALFSTLKQRCRTLLVVADKVLEEPSNSTFLAFPSLQPFDTVEQSVAKNSLIQKENPREADPKRVMQLLPESSDHNERCPGPTPKIRPAEMFDAISLGSLAANETSEERHATGEKTVNVPNISLNDSVKSTGVAGRSTGGAGSKRDWAWKYCPSIPGNSNGVICSFCDLEIKGGGITRFKSHISGSDLSKNVKKCENVPPEVKAEIDQKGKKRR